MPKKRMLVLIIAALLLTGCSSAMRASDTAVLDAEDMILESANSITLSENNYAKGAQAVPITSGMSSFSFSNTPQRYTDDEGNVLLLEQIDQVSFVSGSAETNSWVNEFLSKKLAEDLHYSKVLYGYAQNDLKKNGSENFYAYSHYVTMGIARHDESIASLISLSSVNSGGVYPNSVQTAYNFDFSSKTILKLEDVIYEDAAAELCNIVKQEVTHKFSSLGQEALNWNYDESIEKTMVYGSMTPYWYFNSTGLVIFFNQYELTPDAAGVVKIEIPYEDLRNILRDDFFPEEKPNSLTTKIDQLEAPAAGTVVLTADLGEGECRYLTVSDAVYGVQISEVYFVEDTPVGQRMVLSADYIDETISLEVVFDPADTSRTYALTFNDLVGNRVNVYIHPNGTSFDINLAD